MGSNSESIPVPVQEAEDFLINKHLLELILKQEVVSFKLSIGSNPGDNYMSVIHSAEVTVKNSENPKFILFKCYPSHPGRREFLDESNVFGKEIFFYDKWAPALTDLVNEIGRNTEITLAIPEFLGGNYNGSGIGGTTFPDPWSKENFVVMTDARHEGYKMASRIKGLDFDHVKLAMKELATLHALGWCYKVKKGCSRIAKVHPEMEESMFNENFEAQFKPLMESIASRSLTMIGEAVGFDHPIYQGTQKIMNLDQTDLLRTFIGVDGIDEDYAEKNLRVPPETSDDYVKDPWLVSCHGDFWVNNMLFKYDEETNKPVSVILLDLQMIREACPTTDLAYFFYSSTTFATRAPNEDTFLQTYFDQFVSVCAQLNCELLPGFSLETLKRRFRRSKIFGFSMSMPILSVVLKPPEDAVELDKVEGDMAEIFSSVMEGGDKNKCLKDRFVEIATEFYESGVI